MNGAIQYCTRRLHPITTPMSSSNAAWKPERRTVAQYIKSCGLRLCNDEHRSTAGLERAPATYETKQRASVEVVYGLFTIAIMQFHSVKCAHRPCRICTVRDNSISSRMLCQTAWHANNYRPAPQHTKAGSL